MITLLLLVRATYIRVLFFAHPVRGESRIQRNTNGEVATTHVLIVIDLLQVDLRQQVHRKFFEEISVLHKIAAFTERKKRVKQMKMKPG